MMRRGLWIAMGVIVVIVLVALFVFGSYVSSKNQMVALQENVQENWAQVNVVIERRADLIPNLVATVKGYAQHEEKIFDDVANARTALINAHSPAGTIAANQQMDGALGRLLAISESYPDLKANQNFLALQDQLEGTENRIAVERRRYNMAVQAYNTYVRQFPNSIWAGIAGFQVDKDYFAASAAAQQVPTVKF